MSAQNRIWIWPNRTATGVIAWGSGCYRAEPHRPLDERDGPTGAEYVPAEAFAELLAFVADFAAAKIDALRFPRTHRSPEDEPDPVVDAAEVWAWQEDAIAVLDKIRGAA